MDDDEEEMASQEENEITGEELFSGENKENPTEGESIITQGLEKVGEGVRKVGSIFASFLGLGPINQQNLYEK